MTAGIRAVLRSEISLINMSDTVENEVCMILVIIPELYVHNMCQKKV